MSSLHRLVRPTVLVTVLLAIGTFVVAEPNSASPATVAAAGTVGTVGTVSPASGGSAGPADIRAVAAAGSSDRLTVNFTVPENSAPVAAAGFAPIGAMPAKAQHEAPPPPAPVSTPTPTAKVQQPASSTATQSGYGCGPALAYLAANAAPGFTFLCPGNAYGNQAMTCVNHAPQCAGQKIIAIAVPCPAAYMNEAHNSWVLTGKGSGIDPYGWCH